MDTQEQSTEPQAYLQFREDMESAGWKVYDYRGRFYYHGPAVDTDRNGEPETVEQVDKATCVKVQCDNMALDMVVYPTMGFKECAGCGNLITDLDTMQCECLPCDEVKFFCSQDCRDDYVEEE